MSDPTNSARLGRLRVALEIVASLVAVIGAASWVIGKLASWDSDVELGVFGNTVWEIGLSIVGVAAGIYWVALLVGLCGEVLRGDAPPRSIAWGLLCGGLVAIPVAYAGDQVELYWAGVFVVGYVVVNWLFGPEADRLVALLAGDGSDAGDSRSDEPPDGLTGSGS